MMAVNRGAIPDLAFTGKSPPPEVAMFKAGKSMADNAYRTCLTHETSIWEPLPAW